MFDLKPYQRETLRSLSVFLRKAASSKNIAEVYEQCTEENFGEAGLYHNAGFAGVPYVCLRLPTGGGKTLLAAHTISIATKEYLGKDFSLVLWLVPSTAILEQTLKALQNKRHWYREAIDSAFDGNVNVLTVEDALYLPTASLQGSTTIIISTLQAWRQASTEGRKVYQDNGSLTQHFAHISSDQRSQLEHFEADDGGTLKHSLANVIYLNRPVLIVDEAHNARTPLTFETLQRLNPSCIIEYTATPLTKGKDRSNVLLSVSAATLKTEDIIKMPIELITAEEWHIVVQDAVKKQRELFAMAAEEENETGEYIRPIVLLQAEPDYEAKSSINVDEIKKFLLESCEVGEEEIAIATGAKHEIEGIDLSGKDCKINFIITKEALKEGWDCPFAYIFSSVATVRSSRDVEQLLGRVLRMPNVRKKNREELNHAYAFVYSKDFFHTANNLADALVKSGFTPNEAESLIEIKKRQGELPLFSEPLSRTVTEIPDISKLPKEIREKIEVNKKDSTITLVKPITTQETETLKEFFPEPQDKEVIEQLYRKANRIETDYVSPAKRGEQFSVPQLLLEYDGELRVFDEEVLLASAWNLAECEATLSDEDFPIKVNSGTKGLIDVDSRGAPIIHTPETIQEELSSIFLSSTMQKPELVHWLVKETRHPSITHAQQVVFVSMVVERLMQERGLDVDHLVFMRQRLKETLRDKIRFYFEEAKKKGYQASLFVQPGVVKDSTNKFAVGNEIHFGKDYPVNNTYQGKYKFNKHYYELIGQMNGEEEECAAIIDGHPNVDYWIRNLERQEHYSFWLQTSTDKFYPDFLLKLKNEKILAVEYKSEDSYSKDDSKEKRIIGEFWEAASKGKCLFVMTKGKDWDILNKKLNLGG